MDRQAINKIISEARLEDEYLRPEQSDDLEDSIEDDYEPTESDWAELERWQNEE